MIIVLHRWKLYIILVYFAFTLLGCSSFVKGSGINIFTRFKDIPVYHDFFDVLVPSQLKIDKNKSCIFRTSKFSAGILSLKGNMTSEDLINFFKKNMSKDNWSIVNLLEAKRSIILFKKDSRWCVICINNNKNSRQVEIWVLPNEVPPLPDF